MRIPLLMLGSHVAAWARRQVCAHFRETKGAGEGELLAVPRVERLQVVGVPVGPLADGEGYDDAILRRALARVCFGDRGAHCVAHSPVVPCGGWRWVQVELGLCFACYRSGCSDTGHFVGVEGEG